MPHGTQAFSILKHIAFALAVIAAGNANAARLSSWSWAGTGGSIDSVTFSTSAEGNDAAASGVRSLANTLVIEKTFTDIAGSILDIEFDVLCNFSCSAPTEYAVTEYVTNSTSGMIYMPTQTASEGPSSENGYEIPHGISEIQVIAGFGGQVTGEGFIPSDNPDGIDFDQIGPGSGTGVTDDPKPIDASGTFATCDLCTTVDRLVFKNGLLMPGQTAVLEYQLDVTELFETGGAGSNIFNIPTDFLDPPDGYRFTIRQTATFTPVPIPPALALFVPALFSLFRFRKHACSARHN